MTDLPELVVAGAADWSVWLGEHGASSMGVLLVLAKKVTAHLPTSPTSLLYDQALEEALCQGWIDGRIGKRDEVTYLTRFTPRRARSAWSARNTAIVERLEAAGRMRPAGAAQVQRAREDGRWAAAYAGAATIEVPDDLTAALNADPALRVTFDALSRDQRYALLYRVHTARQPATRARHIERCVAALARSEMPVARRRSADEAAGGDGSRESAQEGLRWLAPRSPDRPAGGRS